MQLTSSERVQSLTLHEALQVPSAEGSVIDFAQPNDKRISATEDDIEQVIPLDLLLRDVSSPRRVVNHPSETTSSCRHEPPP
jgi:hypothetical protein